MAFYQARSAIRITANTALPMENAACILRWKEGMVMLLQLIEKRDADVPVKEIGCGMEVSAWAIRRK